MFALTDIEMMVMDLQVNQVGHKEYNHHNG